MARELLEGMLSEGSSLAAPGRRVGRHESTVAYWVGRYGLRAAHGAAHAARGGIERELLVELVETGATIADISERRCGYRGSMGALHSHHPDPTTKRLSLNAKGVTLALDTLRAEARKCVLLCSNCHAEVEEQIRNQLGQRLLDSEVHRWTLLSGVAQLAE